jgi:hypothetical protein
MKISGYLLGILFFYVVTSLSFKPEKEDIDVHRLWSDCKLKSIISYEVFESAFHGYQEMQNLRKKNIISIIDFSKPSTEKRFFVIDINNKQLKFECFVAHGKNTGDNYAQSFSNQTGSLKSSLGFFLTGETYSGVHGFSLRLDGLEKGINDNARAREIVIHGAEYASEEFIKKYGRLGRSWGCPAVPVEISKELISYISGGSCLFIYADDSFYKKNSVFIRKK